MFHSVTSNMIMNNTKSKEAIGASSVPNMYIMKARMPLIDIAAKTTKIIKANRNSIKTLHFHATSYHT